MKVPINWLKKYVEIPKSLPLLCNKLTMAGHMLDKIDKFGKETVIDLELRGNRADCYSILGVAKEVAALFEKKVNFPPLFENLKKTDQLKDCQIKIDSDYVKRVIAVVIKNVKITSSPEWLAGRLEAYGIPTINNIVDLTNYVMVETGEPMHAFDLDLIKPKVTIRLAKNGEKMTTFEGITLQTTDDDLIWTKEKTPLSIAGAIGSKEYSILPKTKNVLLEAANYDRSNIRRSCQRHKLITEAGIRHEKELDPNLVELGIKRFLQIFKENSWGEIEPIVYDYYPKIKKTLVLSLSYEKLEELGGLKIEPEIVKKIFINLNIKIKKEFPKGLTVVCPTYRTDIIEEADLIEEVLRIYGYEKIPAKILSLEIPPIITPPFITQEEKAKNSLVGLGFNEVISSSFVSDKGKRINNLLLPNLDITKVNLANPPSPDFEQLRVTLLPNLIEITQKVINERGEQACFFEIGKVYFKIKKKYQEKRRLGIIWWNQNQKDNFLKYKGYLEAFFKISNITNTSFKDEIGEGRKEEIFKIFHLKDGIGIGQVLEKEIYFSELDLDLLLGQETPASVSLWPKFPPIIEDLSFTFPEKTPVGEVIQSIKSINPLITNVDLTDSFKETRTFRITYQHSERTLTDEEVKKIREKIISKLSNQNITLKI